jgi:hypothetical protein
MMLRCWNCNRRINSRYLVDVTYLGYDLHVCKECKEKLENLENSKKLDLENK